MGLGRIHLQRIHQRTARLLFEILGAAVPELGGVEYRVVHGRCVAPATLPAMAQRGLLQIDTAHAHHVAGIATYGVAFGQARIEIERLAQRQPGWR